MLSFITRLGAVLLPLYPFALVTGVVMEWLENGQKLHGILLLAGSLAALALVEGVIFRLWILPALGQSLGEKLYGGSYLPEEDELAHLAARIRRTEDASLLPSMRRLVLRQRKRARGWLELARLYQDVAHDEEAALLALLEGSEAVLDREERAMFLYRAGALAADKLQSPARATEYFSRAARLFPQTAYGKHAAARAAGAHVLPRK